LPVAQEIRVFDRAVVTTRVAINCVAIITDLPFVNTTITTRDSVRLTACAGMIFTTGMKPTGASRSSAPSSAAHPSAAQGPSHAEATRDATHTGDHSGTVHARNRACDMGHSSHGTRITHGPRRRPHPCGAITAHARRAAACLATGRIARSSDRNTAAHTVCMTPPPKTLCDRPAGSSDAHTVSAGGSRLADRLTTHLDTLPHAIDIQAATVGTITLRHACLRLTGAYVLANTVTPDEGCYDDQ